MRETHSLLREYVVNGSEAAFRQLVTQFVDLVYSTALRRLNGDAHAAEDVTQTVFTDLARKAETLPAEVMLGGWLHRHCCFVVSNLRRAEMRRAAREKEAVAMENLHAGQPEAAWARVVPDLDEAIEALEKEDREAILLRFFEKRDFKAIGAVIGATENAAQKRVARALEKLRDSLLARGVALSVAALAAGLERDAVAAGPASLAARTAQSALKNCGAQAVAAGAGGAIAYLLWTLLAVAAVAGALGFGIVKAKRNGQMAATAATSNQSATRTTARREASNRASVADKAKETNAFTAVQAEQGPSVQLTVVAGDSGKPIPNVEIGYRATEGGRWVTKTFFTTRDGVARIPYSSLTKDLQLITRTEGFVDTRLFWRTADDALPQEYTVRLKRGQLMGGKIVNTRGELVTGATIHFGISSPDAELAQKRESHEIDNISIVAEDGTWESARIPEAPLSRMHVHATHPDYIDSEFRGLNVDADAIPKLRERKHVIQLRDAMTVQGIVVNSEGQPIPHAKILVGPLHMTGSREGQTLENGRFVITGCTPGTSMVTASAEGFAAKSLRVKQPLPEDGYRIVLERGRLLKLRLVNRDEQPIAKANVWFKTLNSEDLFDASKDPGTQVEFDKRTDADGRVQWDQAPDGNLMFDFAANGYMRKSDVKVAADGVEHRITLAPALKISGTVRDAGTGAAIPKFRVIGGSADETIFPGETKPRIFWSTMDRHWHSFTGGQYSCSWEEPIIYGRATNLFAFKFEAEGYKSYVSPLYGEDAGEVKLDVALSAVGNVNLTVLDTAGQPCPELDVAFVGAKGAVNITDGVIDRNYNFPEPVRSTDLKGQVPFLAEEAEVVVACGKPGFAMVRVADLPADGKIRLQPWGHVQGRILQNHKPVVDWPIRLRAKRADNLRVIAGATTDADGNFTLPFAPEGEFFLVRLKRTDMGRSSMTSEIELRDVQVASGETATADYEENGTVVKLKVRLPDGYVRAENHRLYCFAAIPYPPLPVADRGNPEAIARWRARPDVAPVLAKLRRGQTTQREPGTFVTDPLPPGEWTFNATLMEENLGDQPKPPRGLLSGKIVVTVSENSGETMDGGEIVLTPIAKPPSGG